MWLEQKVTASDGTPEAWFGSSVAISGDLALVGAFNSAVDGHPGQGAVYAFRKVGGSWQPAQKLVAGDGAASDQFGRAIALRGNMAIITAPLATIDGDIWRGAAYVFVRVGNTWVQRQKLVDANGGPFETFGTCVAFDAAHALIGSGGASQGGEYIDRAVHVFRHRAASKTHLWTQHQKIPTAIPEDPTSSFGASVAIEGKMALIGARAATFGQGMVYVYAESAGVWSAVDKLAANDAARRDNFGVSLDIEGKFAFIGAPGATINGNVSQGAVYVFEYGATGWQQTQKIIDPAGTAICLFGASVNVSFGRVLVGGYATQAYRGAAHLFNRIAGQWTKETTLTASDAAQGNVFGYFTALDAKTALVGAYTATVNGNPKQGAAYFYTDA